MNALLASLAAAAGLALAADDMKVTTAVEGPRPFADLTLAVHRVRAPRGLAQQRVHRRGLRAEPGKC
jgi:hypothetical protein